jgi:hypothetical protein
MLENVIAILFTCTLLALAHYFPWRGLLKKELPLLVRYIMGVLALLVPVTVLWVCQRNYQSLLILWAVVICGGSTVFALHLLDTAINARSRADIAEDEGRKLRGQTNKRD